MGKPDICFTELSHDQDDEDDDDDDHEDDDQDDEGDDDEDDDDEDDEGAHQGGAGAYISASHQPGSLGVGGSADLLPHTANTKIQKYKKYK